MKTMKKISVLCLSLACAASVQSAEWYEIPGGDTWNGSVGANWTGYNYNATPDPAAVAAWEATYVPPYSPWTPTPYFVGEPAVSAVPNDGTANLRQNMITARADFGAGDVVNANTLEVADSYWPLNYGAYGSTYTSQEFRHSAGSVTVNTFQIGHDRVNEFAIPNGVQIANNGKYNIRGGSLTAGNIRMKNESKIITWTATTPYGLNWYSISGESGAANNAGNLSVTIGDVYLNETMLYMHMNGGKWTINGDIGLENAGEGNATFMLFGNRTLDRSSVLGTAAELVIKESTLMDMINQGMLWSKTGNSATRYRAGSEFVFVDDPGALLTLDQIPDAHKITLANMYSELNIVDLGGGMASVVVSLVPEPGSIALLALGLGGFLMFRRRS